MSQFSAILFRRKVSQRRLHSSLSSSQSKTLAVKPQMHAPSSRNPGPVQCCPYVTVVRFSGHTR